MSSKVFGDGPDSSSVASPTTQKAPGKETTPDATSKTEVFPFGKKPGNSPLGTRNNTGPDTSALLRQMLVLVVVILVLGAACWFVLKKGFPRFRTPGTSRPKDITVLETTYLPSRQTLYLLQVGTKKLLVAGGKDSLQMLADVTEGFPEQPTDENFQAVLTQQHTGGRKGDTE
jgi:flagellar biogenesis protein FliO